jgi:hypothetical protein
VCACAAKRKGRDGGDDTKRRRACGEGAAGMRSITVEHGPSVLRPSTRGRVGEDGTVAWAWAVEVVVHAEEEHLRATGVRDADGKRMGRDGHGDGRGQLGMKRG